MTQRPLWGPRIGTMLVIIGQTFANMFMPGKDVRTFTVWTCSVCHSKSLKHFADRVIGQSVGTSNLTQHTTSARSLAGTESLSCV